MYYSVGRKHRLNHSGAIIKVLLISLGLLIGAAAGLYVAAKTLPLPTTTTNNFYRTP